MSPRPAIVDTNVVVSGLVGRSPAAPPAVVLDGMLRGSFPFLLSIDLLAEYRVVLLRPRVVARHGLTADEADAILADITVNAVVREPVAAPAAPDPGDQHLWDLLSSEPSAILVTGDHTLLTAPSIERVIAVNAFAASP